MIESIPKVTAWIDEALEKLDCSVKAQMQIDVDQEGSATVEFDFDETSRMVSITFLDQGIPFDPLKKADPDTTLGTEERAIGGLGIFVVKKTMDEISYQYRDGNNVLCLKKRI